jgi:hypothetical protein
MQDDEPVRMGMYERDRAADEKLALQRERSLDNTLNEIRKDISDVAVGVAEIKANDRKRLAVLIASLLIPLTSSLILLFVTVQVYGR